MDDHPWPCVVHRSVRETVERVRHVRAMRGGRSRGWQEEPLPPRQASRHGSARRVDRHRDQHWRAVVSPMRTQSPWPLIVRQVSSPAASSGCSRPARRSPRAPVREGPRQPLPAPTSALSALTAQRGMVFAPLASRRPRSPGRTPWVAGREKPRAPSSQRGIPRVTPLCHTPLGTTEAHFPWRSVRVDHPWSPRARR
jgi:hypothetical protein